MVSSSLQCFEEEGGLPYGAGNIWAKRWAYFGYSVISGLDWIGLDWLAGTGVATTLRIICDIWRRGLWRICCPSWLENPPTISGRRSKSQILSWQNVQTENKTFLAQVRDLWSNASTGFLYRRPPCDRPGPRQCLRPSGTPGEARVCRLRPPQVDHLW